MPQKNLLPGMGLSYHKKNLPLGAEPSCYRKIFRPARSLLATEKSSARRGAFLLQKNLPPGTGPSCHKKISRPDGREIFLFFKQQTICLRASDHNSPLAYLLAISDIGMALI